MLIRRTTTYPAAPHALLLPQRRNVSALRFSLPSRPRHPSSPLGNEDGNARRSNRHIHLPCYRDHHGAIQNSGRFLELPGGQPATPGRCSAVFRLHVCRCWKLSCPSLATIRLPFHSLSESKSYLIVGHRNLRELLLAPLHRRPTVVAICCSRCAVSPNLGALPYRLDSSANALMSRILSCRTVYLVCRKRSDLCRGVDIPATDGKLELGLPQEAGRVVLAHDSEFRTCHAGQPPLRSAWSTTIPQLNPTLVFDKTIM